MEEVNDSIRPICSCGEKMILTEYMGYYDDFKYWECDNEDCPIDEDKLEPENKNTGSYV